MKNYLLANHEWRYVNRYLDRKREGVLNKGVWIEHIRYGLYEDVVERKNSEKSYLVSPDMQSEDLNSTSWNR